jgi:DNA-binding CsgD family transcriptional regulator
MTKRDAAMTVPATSAAARIVVGLSVADPRLAQRLHTLMVGDAHLQVSRDAAHPVDVVVTDRARADGVPSILVDADGHPAGARAVLPPGVGADLLRAAITVVAAGYTLATPDEPPGHDEPPGLADEAAQPHPLPPGEPLTERERQVLALVAHGASNKAIARDLGISVHTAKFHVASLLAKLGARNRSDAVAIGIRRGLVMV